GSCDRWTQRTVAGASFHAWRRPVSRGRACRPASGTNAFPRRPTAQHDVRGKGDSDPNKMCRAIRLRKWSACEPKGRGSQRMRVQHPLYRSVGDGPQLAGDPESTSAGKLCPETSTVIAATLAIKSLVTWVAILEIGRASCREREK